MRNKFIKCDLPSAKYPSSSGNKQLTSLISAPPVLSLDILTSYALVGFPPVSNWASGMVECLAGREEGKAIVKPSKRLGSNYIFTRSRRSRSCREKGMVQSVSQSRRRDTYSGFHILRFHGKGKGKNIARTLFGIRTAQSSRFESPSTVFQLNLSFCRISV